MASQMMNFIMNTGKVQKIRNKKLYQALIYNKWCIAQNILSKFAHKMAESSNNYGKYF